MKKYIVYIVYTSLLFIFGGCDVLDKYPLDNQIKILFGIMPVKLMEG